MVINGVHTKSRQVKDYKRPLKAVAMSPDFAGSSHQRVAAGGLAGSLILNEKGWWGFRDTILQTGDGPILEIKWQSNLIAWASDSGVKVYDVSAQKRVGFVGRPEGSPRPDLFPCHLHWLTPAGNQSQMLLIGWADMVKVVRVNTSNGSMLHPHIQSQLSAIEVTTIFRTDFIVCGLAPLGDQFIFLAHSAPDWSDEDHASTSGPQPPEIRLVDPEDGQASADVLAVRGYEKFKANDYKLAVVPGGDLYYILSPKDLVTARVRDIDDHIEWNLEMSRYEEALNLVRNGTSKQFSLAGVGRQYMEHLLAYEDYERAASLCPDILGEDVAAWEGWVFAFAEIGRLDAIVGHVPTRKPILSSTVYEMILAFFLAADRARFFSTLRAWPAALYNVPSIIEAALDALAEARDPLLLESLAELYQLNCQPEKALEFLLELRNPLAFRLVQEFNLYSAIKDQVVALMQFDIDQYDNPEAYQAADVRETCEGRAVVLLARNIEAIPISSVVEQLHSHPLFLHVYLHALFTRDSHLASAYHDIQVELYAEYDYPLLLNFLKTSNDYSLEKAYRVCGLRDLVPEMVFVLGRMGDHHKALHLIIQRLEDVNQAIDYAKEHDDKELWEDLLKYSSDKPAFLKGLLESAGSHLAPAQVIRAIPLGLEIPGLKSSILQILQDYNLQMSLRRGCEKVLNRDRSMLSQKLKQYQRRAIIPSLECQKCHLPATMEHTTVMFFCNHTYHQECIRVKSNVSNHVSSYGDLFPKAAVVSTLHQKSPDAQAAVDLVASKNEYAILMGKAFTQCPRCRDLQAESDAQRQQRHGNRTKLRWNWEQPNLMGLLNPTVQSPPVLIPSEDSDLPPMVNFSDM
ncbi:Vacuolar protein sorting-associated protein 41, variant 4 [Entomophthora muscae]|nr:Vacuolar protein sorting-associated protein 41, variant 4 [Entomophthora muscae]